MSDAKISDSTPKAELYRAAKRLGVEGRSKMSKRQLRQALAKRRESSEGESEGKSGESGGGGVERAASRFEQFRLLADAAARGEFVMLPRLLSGDDRRLHVRQTLREDHQTRISRADEEAATKFDKLAGSLFSFFRGTALLFYRDMAGQDQWMPSVLALGDVHPGNFGVMPNADNVPIFGVNDFDESAYAPFTWDLKRGAVGFMIGAAEMGGLGDKACRKIAKKFVRGYIVGIRRFAEEDSERSHEMRLDNAPKMIAKLLESAQESRADWLAGDYLDEFRRGFRATGELVPVSRRRDEFQALVDAWRKENDVQVPRRAGEMRVKDVAVRRGAGTASLGLPRYYLLIEGPGRDGSDDLIVEFKQARRSALAGLVPPSSFNDVDRGARVVHAQAVQLVRGDVFFGHATFEGRSFLSRERPPFKDDVDLDNLDKKGWKTYAKICGQTLAHAHALSDETGALDYDIEPAILRAVNPQKLFVADILRYAHAAARRLRRDHEAFQKDHARGAFKNIDVMFR